MRRKTIKEHYKLKNLNNMENSFKITGKLTHRGTTDKKSDKFSIRNLRIEVETKFKTETICFDLHNKNTPKLDGVALNDFIEVSFNIRGNQWQGRFFNNLVAYDIKTLETNMGADDDDMPF
tara:strand:- start:89 stop:451 length:363 start_codon:yes stop_codon:yes gene_type:complete